MELIRGQKSKLSDITSSSLLSVGISIIPAPGQTIDISCFGLDESGKLSDDRYFIFYNQKASPCGSLVSKGALLGEQQVFEVDLARLPLTIKRLVFTATIDGPGNFSSAGDGRLRLIDGVLDIAVFRFSGKDFAQEKAIIIAELYFKDVWRFAVNGQGFNGGLSALLAHFGGTEIPVVQPSPPPPPPKVNLGKVSLDKRGSSQAVNLKKSGGNQPIHVNLNWDSVEKKGWFGSSTVRVDLDLGCMYHLTTGEKGVIQPLGNSFGSKNSPPFIYLDKDDRSGASSDGENMFILRPDLIELVVIFAMIYEGTANFSSVNGRLTIKDENGSEILVPLNNPDAKKLFCAVAQIKQESGAIRITKDELYFDAHPACDQHYGFGFRWVEGRK